MIDFTNAIVVDRPVGDVYDYLSDLERIPEWNWAISRTQKITPGARRVGTRYQQARTTPQPSSETLEITGLEANRFIGIEGTLAGMPARLHYALEDHGSKTEIRNSVRLELGGALQLAAPILSRRISRAVASNLNDLKTRLERTTRPLDREGNLS